MAKFCKTLILVCVLFGCSEHKSKPVSSDACSTLSDEEIASVQGEAVADKTPSQHPSSKLLTSQCFYRLATFNRSINVEITRPAAAGDASALAGFWQQRFGQTDEDRDEHESSNKGVQNKAPDRDREEEEHRARPDPVSGLGEEAYWIGNQLNGSLYVRQDSFVLRLSVGGPDDQPAKIKKATTLAGLALKRLNDK